MKKILATSSIGVALALCLVTGVNAHAPRQTNSTPTASPTATPSVTPIVNPIQGNSSKVVLYVDTVQGTGGNPAPDGVCVQTNSFRQGQVIVFRMWGVNVALGGKALKPWNVKTAYVTIPGKDNLTLTYGAHGKAPNQHAFWTTSFNTTGYPIGTLDYSVVVQTKANKKFHAKAMTASYPASGSAPISALQITP